VLLARAVNDEMEGMSRSPRNEQALRAMRRGIRSVLLLMVLTVGALYFNRRGFYPHGNPLTYALAMSWLISFTVALPITAIFAVFKVNPKPFALARWEKEGEVYDRWSLRAFRWVLLHSPLGWINANLYLSAGRTDCERLLREMSFGERVHWVTCFLSSILAISWVAGDYAVYGYVMLLVRIPFDLYPIMLLRRNRGRVCRVLSRQLRTSG
jgi:Glycosyl-4,4'-diaponeurosporenoate acyltransferase